MGSRPIILSIAGYDPSSGAGVTADVKTAAALGCYAATCITALTVQSTQAVFGLELVRSDVVRNTLNRLSDDVEFAAVRIGMLGSGEIATTVADFVRQIQPKNVVLDPVLKSTSGALLVDEQGLAVIRDQLLPLCDVITPNFAEASVLCGMSGSGEPWPTPAAEPTLPDLQNIARKLHEIGCKSIVITGGDLAEPSDYLSTKGLGGAIEQVFPGSRMESNATHGTGCAFATALACKLAHGLDLPLAVREAKEYVRRAILSAYPMGKGIGPMNHLFRLED
jgi:hydroxymethylpyrimidine/phosphomethylpyrimidine kinase